MSPPRRSRRLWWLLAAIAFILMLLVIAAATMPASVVAGQVSKANPELSIRGASGTIWRGYGRVRYQTLDLGEVRWQLDPWALFRLTLQAKVEIDGDGHEVNAVVALDRPDQVAVSDLQFSIGADRLRQLEVVDFGQLLGTLVGQFSSARFDRTEGVIQLVGEASWQDAGWRSDIVVRLSDLNFSFPNVTPPQGLVEDLGGPLQVTGSVQFVGRQAITRLNLLSRGQDSRLDEALHWIGQPTADGGRFLEIVSAF